MIVHANFLLIVTKFGEITHFVFIYLIGWSRSHRARNRWFVAYTLLRNPGLQELTASRMEEKAYLQYEHVNTTYEAINQSDVKCGRI